MVALELVVVISGSDVAVIGLVGIIIGSAVVVGSVVVITRSVVVVGLVMLSPDQLWLLSLSQPWL